MYSPRSISKRCFDILFAIFALVALSGLLILVAMAVKLTSKGSVLYWSRRIGKDNIVFSMPKFRTMRTDTPVVATYLLSNSDVVKRTAPPIYADSDFIAYFCKSCAQKWGSALIC